MRLFSSMLKSLCGLQTRPETVADAVKYIITPLYKVFFVYRKYWLVLNVIVSSIFCVVSLSLSFEASCVFMTMNTFCSRGLKKRFDLNETTWLNSLTWWYEQEQLSVNYCSLFLSDRVVDWCWAIWWCISFVVERYLSRRGINRID